MITGGVCSAYGLSTWGDLFTPRQVVVLTTFSGLVEEARERARRDAIAAGLPGDGKSAVTSADIYADAVSVYLAFAVSKTTNRCSSLCTFKIAVQCPGDTFGRQAFPMSWDYAEANTVAGPSGSFDSMCANTVAGILSTGALFAGVRQGSCGGGRRGLRFGILTAIIAV
jgi:putative DNA methylase